MILWAVTVTVTELVSCWVLVHLLLAFGPLGLSLPAAVLLGVVSSISHWTSQRSPRHLQESDLTWLGWQLGWLDWSIIINNHQTLITDCWSLIWDLRFDSTHYYSLLTTHYSLHYSSLLTLLLILYSSTQTQLYSSQFSSTVPTLYSTCTVLRLFM